MSERIKVLLSEEEVDARIQQVAAKISKDYAGKEVHLICVLKGGVFFTQRRPAGLPESGIRNRRTVPWITMTRPVGSLYFAVEKTAW